MSLSYYVYRIRDEGDGQQLIVRSEEPVQEILAWLNNLSRKPLYRLNVSIKHPRVAP